MASVSRSIAGQTAFSEISTSQLQSLCLSEASSFPNFYDSLNNSRDFLQKAADLGLKKAKEILEREQDKT